MEAYRTPDERFEGLPGYSFEPHYVEQDGLRMHYVEEGSGDPVLLLHGEPTWAFLYRTMIPPLARVARVVAPDYFGFGRSDKPTRIEDYCIRLPLRIDRAPRRRARPARDATVVVQDWGGPIGLRLAVERPDRVARLVDPEHGRRRRPRALGGVAALSRVRPPSRQPISSPVSSSGSRP